VKKSLIVSVFVLTLALGVGAVYLGSRLNNETNVTPEDAKASSPSNCQLDLTQANPKADPNMGVDNNGPYSIPMYCPGTNGRLSVTKAGKLVFYTSRPDISIKLGTETLSSSTGIIKTTRTVKVGDTITVSVIGPNGAAIGWVNPIGDMCGDPAWGAITIKPLLDKVTADKNTVMEKQCWGDEPQGKSDFDFDDYQVVVAVEADPTVVSTVSTLTSTTAVSSAPVSTSPTAMPVGISPTIAVVVNNQSATAVSPTVIVVLPTSESQISNASSLVQAQSSASALVCSAVSACNTTSDCQLGNSCLSISGGAKRCVADMCVTNGTPNDICEADLCTAKSAIQVSKSVQVSCISGQNSKRLSYTVVLTNPSGNQSARKNISVVDTLDAQLESSYVIRTSIPMNGSYSNGSISWDNLSLMPNGSRLELKYEAIIPASEYGKQYVNKVVVSENNVIRGSKTITTLIALLPCTALISDQMDLIILGVIIVLMGLIMYRIGIDRLIGDLFWHKGGRNILYRLYGDHDNNLFKADKKEFEKKIRKRTK